MSTLTGASVTAPQLSSLSRGLQILAVIHRSGRLTAAEIASGARIPLSSTYRYLQALSDAGFVLDVDGYFMLSQHFTESGAESDHLVRYAAPVLRRLRDETRMTALLTVRIRTAAVCLEAAVAHPKHRISFQRGTIRALYAGASVLPLLALAPPSVIREIRDGELRRFTANTPQREGLDEILDDVRRSGFAVSHGHLTPGMVGVGVPVLIDGRCLCAISLVGDSVSFAHLDGHLSALRAARDELLARMPSGEAGLAWTVSDEE